MTIEENGLPAASAPVVSGAVGGWIGPSANVAFGGSDNLGLRKLELLAGGTAKRGKAGQCVDWSVRPCAEGPGGIALQDSATVSTLGLGSGAQQLRTRSTDAAGNVSQSGTTPVNVDVDAPVATGLGGGGASRAPQRTINWTASQGGSPIVGTEVKVCTAGGERCETFPATKDGPFTLDIATWGDATAVVIQKDAVGNVGTSSPVGLKYDVVPPRAPKVDALSGGNGDAQRVFRIAALDTDVTSLASRLCTGSSCRDLPATAGAGGDLTVQLPEPGVHRLEVRATDAAGNTGEPTVVGVDWTPAALVPTPPSQPEPVQTPPGSQATPPPAATPGPTTPPATRSSRLTATFPKRLGRSSLTISGTVTAGSAKRVVMKISGRRPGGRAFSLARRTSPKASGRYSLRIALPKQFRRETGVLVEISASPGTGWSAPKVARRRLR